MELKEVIIFISPLFNEEHKQVLTLVFLFLGSIWGVLVKYITHIKKEKVAFSFLIFLGEIMAHSFAGMLSYFSCRGFEINENFTIVITLVSAYMGLKMLNKVEDEIMDGLDELSESIKRWLKRILS